MILDTYNQIISQEPYINSLDGFKCYVYIFPYYKSNPYGKYKEGSHHTEISMANILVKIPTNLC